MPEYLSHTCNSTDKDVRMGKRNIHSELSTQAMWFETDDHSFRIAYCPYCGKSASEVARGGGVEFF